MELVLSTLSLAGVGGSETYVVTVADQLQRLGHGVWLHAVHHGAGSELAQELGLRLCRTDGDLPEAPDALIVQDGGVAYELAARYPTTPQLFVAHSDLFDLQLPPQLPGVVSVVVALYDRVEHRLRALAQPPEIVRLTQPIDVDRFKPLCPLRERPGVALAFSNYLDAQRMSLLQGACEQVGIELRHAGSTAAGGPRPAIVSLNEADIVFGKARVIYEAMACARAAYVFDHNGGDGWVTPANFERLSADNFGGQSGGGVIDHERLVADLTAYERGMGTVNRDLVVAHNSATKHAAQLVRILERLTPRAAPLDGPLHELARLVRLYHRADSLAFGLRTEMERVGARVHELELELGRSRIAERDAESRAAAAEAAASHASADAESRAAAAEAAARYASADAHEARAQSAAAHVAAADSRRALSELTATRRWRAIQSALAPIDRLRCRLRGGRWR